MFFNKQSISLRYQESCILTFKEAKMKDQEYEKVLRQAYEEILNQKKFDISDRIFAKDVVMYDGKDTVRGLEEGKRLIRERSEAVPNFHTTIDDILISGNKAAVRWHSSGKAIRDFADFKAGQETKYEGVTVFEMQNNLISKLWQYGTAIDISVYR